MFKVRLRAAACAASLALACSTAATAQSAPPHSPAATLWLLRSGLNVAALACRGPAEPVIVAGYNQLLTDYCDPLAESYRRAEADYGSPAAFDAAMTRLYNDFARPEQQAALCANAVAVLDTVAARHGAALDDLADAALAQLDGADVVAANQVAVASIPQVLDLRAAPVIVPAAVVPE